MSNQKNIEGNSSASPKEALRISHKQLLDQFSDGVPETSNDVDFSIKQEPLFTRDGTPTNYWCNRRTDNGMPVGQVSEHYSVIEHRDLLDRTEMAFALQGLSNFKRDIVSYNYGARMASTYTFGNYVRKVKANSMKKGDDLALRISVRNSHDGSSQATFRVGMLRLVCTNGMTSLQNEISANKRHKGVISLEYISLGVAQAVKQFEDSLMLFGALANRKIMQREGVIILQSLANRKILSDRFHQEVAQVWNRPSYEEDQDRNMYNLYNAVTERISRKYDAKGQVEASDRINNATLTAIASLSNNDDMFQHVMKSTVFSN